MSDEISPEYLTKLHEEYRSTCPREYYERMNYTEPPRPQEPVVEEFCNAATDFLRENGLLDSNYETQIKALYEYCERHLNANLVYPAIGCSESYARRFSYDSKRGAYQKEWSKSAQKQKVSPGTRDRILARDGACLRCGSNADLEVHHIHPVSAGGTKEDSNLATLCVDCHRAAHAGSKTISGTAYNIEDFDNWLNGRVEESVSPEENSNSQMIQTEIFDF